MSKKMNSWSGFTLPELVVTLVILSVLSAVIVPITATANANSRLTACAERIADDIRYTRTQSMTNPNGYNEVFEVIISLGLNYYRIERYNGTTNVPISDPLEPYRNLVFDLDDSPEFRGLRLQSTTSGVLAFDRQGRPYPDNDDAYDGINQLMTVWNLVLEDNSGRTKTILVYPITGIVTIQ